MFLRRTTRFASRFGAIALPVLAVCVHVGCGDDEPSREGRDTPDGSTLQDGGPGDDGSMSTDDASPDGSATESAPFDWVGIIGTGQSLSVGATAGVVSTKQPFSNGRLIDTGADPKYPLTGGAPKFAITPLIEPGREKSKGTGPGYTDGQYPNNIAGETPHSGMANEISALFLARTTRDYLTLHSVVGWSGHPLVDINKAGGARAYPASLMEARALKDLAKAAGKTFGYGAIILTHGESDAGNKDYNAGIKQLVKDYNVDLKAITGQTRDVYLLVSQQSVFGAMTGSAVQVWKAGVEDPLIVCTGPKYQYMYSVDHLHFPATGYRSLGEKYGEVFDLVVNQGKKWKPVQPTAATRTGANVVVSFDVPNPPLEWDYSLDLPHQTKNTAWKNGRGFEAWDAAKKPLTIASVAISSANTVTITLAAAPAGPVTIGYAAAQDGTNEEGTGNNGGLATGYRGQLRDSDTLVGYDAEKVTAKVTKGSAAVTLTGGTKLVSHSERDVATTPGGPANWIIKAVASPTSFTLSAPWGGADAEVTLDVHHDLHNYGVHSFVVTN